MPALGQSPIEQREDAGLRAVAQHQGARTFTANALDKPLDATADRPLGTAGIQVDRCSPFTCAPPEPLGLLRLPGALKRRPDGIGTVPRLCAGVEWPNPRSQRAIASLRDDIFSDNAHAARYAVQISFIGSNRECAGNLQYGCIDGIGASTLSITPATLPICKFEVVAPHPARLPQSRSWECGLFEIGPIFTVTQAELRVDHETRLSGQEHTRKAGVLARINNHRPARPAAAVRRCAKCAMPSTSGALIPTPIVNSS